MYKDLNDEIQRLKNIERNNEYSMVYDQMADKRKRIENFKWSLKK